MIMKLKYQKVYKYILLGLVLVQVTSITTVNAEIFKCTNQSGKVFYNDKPCPSLDEEKKMRSEKDVVNGYVPKALIKNKKGLKKSNSRSFEGEVKPVLKSKNKRKSKAENTPSSRRLSGGGTKRKVAEKLSDESEHSFTAPPKGNYADRAGTLEEKRIYLGIRRQVE